MFVVGRLVFCGYKAMKAVRVNNSGCNLLLWLIHFVTDEDSPEGNSCNAADTQQYVNEMFALVDDESEDN